MKCSLHTFYCQNIWVWKSCPIAHVICYTKHLWSYECECDDYWLLLSLLLWVHPFSSPPFRRLPFRCGDTSLPAISSRGHLVAWHFVAGTIRRQLFRRGDTPSPAVSSRGHFVKGRRGWRTKTSICKYKCLKIININFIHIINDCYVYIHVNTSA